MTAPIDRPRSGFAVPHTPVTYAPNTRASCTANAPTPPTAPMIRTFCPGLYPSRLQRPCRAVHAEMGTDAACPKVRLADLGAH
jgi:hypothetical protein